MSWRRYVFLDRIHPHSILIGFSLLCRKKREGTEVRGRMNHEGMEGGASVLLWVSIFTSPAMPSNHRDPHNSYTPTYTFMHMHFSWSLVLLCGSVMHLYWSRFNNSAADIPSVLDKVASQKHDNNAELKLSPSDCQRLPEQWPNW